MRFLQGALLQDDVGTGPEAQQVLSADPTAGDWLSRRRRCLWCPRSRSCSRPERCRPAPAGRTPSSAGCRSAGGRRSRRRAGRAAWCLHPRRGRPRRVGRGHEQRRPATAGLPGVTDRPVTVGSWAMALYGRSRATCIDELAGSWARSSGPQDSIHMVWTRLSGASTSAHRAGGGSVGPSRRAGARRDTRRAAFWPGLRNTLAAASPSVASVAPLSIPSPLSSRRGS